MEKKLLADSLGYFDNEKREYVIENMFPFRPLKNYLWSDKVACFSDQFGYGEGFAAFDGFRRFMDKGERLVFIKDLETGEVYSPTRNFKREGFDAYRCHVGVGYQRVASSYKGLDCAFEIAVPPDDYAIQYGVTLKNRSEKPKRFALFVLIKLFTDISGHESYGTGDKDSRFGGLYYPHKAYKSPTAYGDLYFAAEKPFDSYAVVMRDFTGTYGCISEPDFVKAGALPSRGSTFELEYVAATSYTVELQAGEVADYHFALATGKDFDEAASVALKNCTAEEMKAGIEAQRGQFERVFSAYEADIPDEYMQTLINIWLKRQVSLGKSWGRVYGKGYRDVLQDITAFVSFDVDKARERLLTTLAYQYQSGTAVRMYDPIFLAKYNDSCSWIPDAVTTYIKESGDFGILEEVVPFYDGGEATVLTHIVRAMEYLTTDVGERGLTLFREGDWNDSTNGAGVHGKGESVWTSLATVRALKLVAELAEKTGNTALQAQMLQKAETLTERILQYGLDHGHFIHGYDDNGNVIGGGDESQEASFCLNMQTWAVLADVGGKELQNRVMDMVEEKLRCDYGYVLNTPPYTKPVEGVGRTSYFQPGLVENASVYIHGSMFKAVADCLLGRGDRAYETVCKVTYRHNPDSGVEPYAVSNMFIGPSNKYRARQAPMSWVTGSAGWMYRALTEYVLGIRTDYDGIRFTPCVPSAWKEFSVKRQARGASYQIFFKRTGRFSISANGEKIQGNLLPYAKRGEQVCVEVEF